MRAAWSTWERRWSELGSYTGSSGKCQSLSPHHGLEVSTAIIEHFWIFCWGTGCIEQYSDPARIKHIWQFRPRSIWTREWSRWVRVVGFQLERNSVIMSRYVILSRFIFEDIRQPRVRNFRPQISRLRLHNSTPLKFSFNRFWIYICHLKTRAPISSLNISCASGSMVERWFSVFIIWYMCNNPANQHHSGSYWIPHTHHLMISQTFPSQQHVSQESHTDYPR